MDETGTRALLERVASTEPPPSQVNVAAARSRGRRKLRWRRARLSTSTLAVAVAVALIVIGVVPVSLDSGPSGEPSGDQSGPAATGLSNAVPTRSHFSVLVPYASFGWLPAGFSVSAGNSMANPAESTTLSVSLTAGDAADGRLLILTVNAAGSCRLAGPHELSCDDGGGTSQKLTLSGSGPVVDGTLAFWTADDSLVWQYARGSWAQLSPSVQAPDGLPTSASEHWLYDAWAGWMPRPARHGYPATVQSAATRAELLTVAGQVSYGNHTAMVFPFQLTGLPAGWTVTDSTFAPSGGRLLGTGLDLGPADDPGAMSISIAPAGGPDACKFVPGQSQYVTIAGAQGTLRIIDEPDKHWQDLCSSDVHGMQLDLSLDLNVPGTSDTPLPGASSLGGVLEIFQHLRLLDPSPAGWTTRPLG
jgi:hypothetical protein